MHNLWVTQYDPEEMFPGGEFPNQNPRVGEGLATWVKKDRSLEETDLVLWYPLSCFSFYTRIMTCFVDALVWVANKNQFTYKWVYWVYVLSLAG